ncbi:hypothetical protein G3N55_01515 [Dissulfurirhabdus thermomarina]|uniref:Doubled CXXCH motif domain-containing protein n=1 Tax=Dissulfurirhabdus thermomarina TaxID=1765737 RepID=A0A6N9TJU6_DISTH|nr:cytochrome c3 family protein [Dissulfurirhabdus thermomarina]NDY41532.1 hypothetical protein [Dissulfurirhabdus thermomarina]NMX22949.1 hypothetical protein [Dissulfurirhabdus thermomarina]
MRSSRIELFGAAVLFGAFLAFSVLGAPGVAVAKVQGQCAQCHTMHNSQNGQSIVSTPNGALIATENGCIGCHTGTNTGANNIPYILSTSTPNYGATGTTGDTLAGGNFYFVATAGNATDAAGHNVAGLAASDAQLGLTPPGGQALLSQLTCAGVNGCHGDRTKADDFTAVSGAHHGDDSVLDGSTVAQSYRFLLGVTGIEDSDWEYQPTVTAHNQYNGYDRAQEADVDNSTISALCAKCHGDFHSGAGDLGPSDDGSMQSAWIRHPTDFDMGNVKNKEYGAYNGGNSTAAPYSVVAPVGSDLDTVPGVQQTVFDEADDAIVMCLSCHRAHATPYADALRWDYSAMVAGSGAGNVGCFICHTTKD